MVTLDSGIPVNDWQELHSKALVVLRAGKLGLSSGMGAYRVREIMVEVATALGITNSAHVTLTEINSTCHNGNLSNTEVATLASVGVDSNKISALHELLAGLKKKDIIHSVDCINEELSKIEQMKKLYRSPFNGLWAAIACFGFTILIGGSGFEALGAFLGAYCGQTFRSFLLKRHFNQFVDAALSVFVAGCVYMLYFELGSNFGLFDQSQSAGYVGALLFVIPGFPLVTGGLDMAKLDFSSGVNRSIYAWLIIVIATVIGWVFSLTFNLTPRDMISPYAGLGALWVVLQFAMSFAGVFGFALMFNSKPKVALTAAIIGAICNTLRLQFVEAGLVPFVSAAFCATLVGLISSAICDKYNFTRITLTVPAIVIMVPGSQLFRAFYEFGTDNPTTASHYLVKAVLTVIALPVGLAVARFLTDAKWRKETVL
ncbi:membrane protein [Actinomycetota bacterium]|nr:membrane protein [Actinomycetota bacterium]